MTWADCGRVRRHWKRPLTGLILNNVWATHFGATIPGYTQFQRVPPLDAT